jgi:hypothetical protein
LDALLLLAPTLRPPPARRLLANLYNGNLYLWNHSDQVRTRGRRPARAAAAEQRA